MQLTLVSFLCDTWTLAPSKLLRELDMGPSFCSLMGGSSLAFPSFPVIPQCAASC